MAAIELGARLNLSLLNKYGLDYLKLFKPCDFVTIPRFGPHGFSARGSKVDELSQLDALAASNLKLHGHRILSKRDQIKFDSKEHLQSWVSQAMLPFQRFDSWDVLNEVFADDGLVSMGADLGDDWISYALEAAREAAPNAELWINEYGPKDQQMWEHVIAYSSALKKRGLLDGVGIQLRSNLRKRSRAQWLASQAPKWATGVLNVDAFEGHIAALKKAGLKVHLSELTAYGREDQAKQQGVWYKRWMDAAIAHQVDRVSFWTMADGPPDEMGWQDLDRGNPGLYAWDNGHILKPWAGQILGGEHG